MSNKKNDKRKEKKKTKKKSGILKKILIILIIILLALVGFITYKTQVNGGGMTGLLSTLVGNDENTLEELEPLQVLLLGISSDLGTKLTDTIIVATYNPQKQTASLLSIPRDTYTGNNIKNGTGSEKINALYTRGIDKLLDEVNELTGLDLKYYMVVDNQALIELVDLIGGVEFDVPYVPGGMVYDDPTQNLHINLEPGLQLIDGEKAEQLLRFRKNNSGSSYPASYGSDDIGRMKTQRNFMIATAKQTLNLKNIFKIRDIIDIVYEYVDTNLSISTIKAYIPYAIDFNIENIRSASLPGTSVGPPEVPLWFIQVNKKEAAELMEELYGDGEEETENSGEGSSTSSSSASGTSTSSITSTTSSSNSSTSSSTSGNSSSSTASEEDNSSSSLSTITKTEASKIKVEILNGSGSSKKLTEVKKLLTNKGYNVSKTGTTTDVSKTTIINKSDVDSKFENNIKDLLGVGNISSSSASSSNVDITIIIGKDYK